MAQNNALARVSVIGGDESLGNYGGSDIGPYLVVILDTTNYEEKTVGAIQGVTLPASDAKPYGVTVDTLKALSGGVPGIGLVQTMGLAVGTASATIHVGDYLKCDNAGKVLPQTSGTYQTGIARSEALSGDLVRFRIAFAKNA